jgi:hypothetical protein
MLVFGGKPWGTNPSFFTDDQSIPRRPSLEKSTNWTGMLPQGKPLAAYSRG